MILVVTTNGIFVVDMSLYSLLYTFQQIAVFCLSLMAENWPEYITEAKRCLAKNVTAFYCGDDKVAKWKIVHIEKNPRGRGIPKICRRGKRRLHFSRS